MSNYNTRGFDSKSSASRTSSSAQYNRLGTQNPPHKDDVKGKILNKTIEGTSSFPKFVPQPSATNVKVIDT